MNHVRVGVGVIVVKDDKVLMGKRIGSHGENSWSFPGGHLEMFESVHECAKREVKEETGIEIKNLQDVTFTNDILGVKKSIILHFLYVQSIVLEK